MLPPGSTIGILGGGQLGRMLALAAARLGFRCHIYCPDPDSPAFDVAAERTVAAYEDAAALEAFAASVDVVTYEFENVDVAAAERIAAIVPVRPGPRALAVSQDRLTEKLFLRELGIATAPFAAVGDPASLDAALVAIGRPAVLKTRRFGYDGKGQLRIGADTHPHDALAAIGDAPAILEGFVPFSREVSMVAARGLDGGLAAYDLAENVHRDGILRSSTVPAAIAPHAADEARRIAEQILLSLDYVGMLGVEFFVVAEGGTERLLVNEIAPRVHNSGHWTEDACAVSQFENHVRAIAGWPLGPARRRCDAVMTNLIGRDAEGWRDLAAEPDARLHLYGKREARPGRKMGHVNRLAMDRSPPAGAGSETPVSELFGLDHVQLAMPPGREAEARAFYGGLLGMSEAAKPVNLAKRGGCWFRSGALAVHLGVEADFRPARKAHPAFLVRDLAALAEKLRKGGHRVREEEPLTGYARLYVDDPFGNRIELMQPSAGAALPPPPEE
jgi:5-(carboxyamino)imidazole ribonucleotide synthase